MARDYNTIHFIQDNLADKPSEISNVIIRMYNRLVDRKCYASGVSTSITLFLALSYLQYQPQLILGTVQYQGVSYPHAWLELDEKIYDLAISLDTQYQPVLVNRDIKMVNVQVNKSYADADVEYYAFQFGDTWIMSNMHSLVGKSFVEYIDNAPYFDIMNDACYILELPETKENLDKLLAIAKNNTIMDEEVENV